MEGGEAIPPHYTSICFCSCTVCLKTLFLLSRLREERPGSAVGSWSAFWGGGGEPTDVRVQPDQQLVGKLKYENKVFGCCVCGAAEGVSECVNTLDRGVEARRYQK